MQGDDKKYEVVERKLGRALRDNSAFDRLAFAMRALDVLKPKNMKVVVYERIDDMHIEQGREDRLGPNGSWAIVGIPRHASREHIAVSLAELTGMTDVPYLIDVLIRA